jgi:hypothetical protein
MQSWAATWATSAERRLHVLLQHGVDMRLTLDFLFRQGTHADCTHLRLVALESPAPEDWPSSSVFMG